jgi:ATP dependent DNA ligase domain
MQKSDRATMTPTRRRVERTSLPAWVKPQLAALVKKAPDGPDWLHEIKLDGYRMHARLDAGRVKILTRRGNDWTQKYPAIAKAIAGLPAQDAYLDGELCGVLPDGRTAFNLIQNAADASQGSLVFFLFDLLFLDGEDIRDLPLVDRKARLEAFLVDAPKSLRYNDHQIGQGPAFHRLACENRVNGLDLSKRLVPALQVCQTDGVVTSSDDHEIMTCTQTLRVNRFGSLARSERLAVPPKMSEHAGPQVSSPQRIGVARASHFGPERGEGVDFGGRLAVSPKFVETHSRGPRCPNRVPLRWNKTEVVLRLVA